MRIERRHLEKVDERLRTALAEARGGEILRAVLVLGPANAADEVPFAVDVDPAEFRSREAYRQELINRQRKAVTAFAGETIESLNKLGLNPRGATLGHTVVVEGPAVNILMSLDLPGVAHASLDQPVLLISPKRRGIGSS